MSQRGLRSCRVSLAVHECRWSGLPYSPHLRPSGAHILHRYLPVMDVHLMGGGSSMKRMALLSVAFAAMLTVGCRGDRPYSNAENPNEAIGTSGYPAETAKPADRGTQKF